MKLALRTGAAVDSGTVEKASASVIKTRLVTDYPHSGIVIGETLYHATAKHGLCDEPFRLENWTLIDLGDERDEEGLALYEKYKGADYDWFSLLAFALIPASDSERLYCYEWCYLAMTGMNPGQRITAETLLMWVIQDRDGRK